MMNLSGLGVLTLWSLPVVWDAIAAMWLELLIPTTFGFCEVQCMQRKRFRQLTKDGRLTHPILPHSIWYSQSRISKCLKPLWMFLARTQEISLRTIKPPTSSSTMNVSKSEILYLLELTQARLATKHTEQQFVKCSKLVVTDRETKLLFLSQSTRQIQRNSFSIVKVSRNLWQLIYLKHGH